MLIAGQGIGKAVHQGTFEGDNAVILEQVNQFAKRPIVFAAAVGGVEPTGAQAAQGATALFIERRAVEEGGAALDANEFRFKWLAGGQTSVADRYAGKSGERGFADSAVGGVQKIAGPAEKRPQGTGDLERQPVLDNS